MVERKCSRRLGRNKSLTGRAIDFQVL